MKKKLFRWCVTVPVLGLAVVLCLFLGRDKAIRVLDTMTKALIK